VTAALLRFWWIVVLGVLLGGLLAAWMVYELPGFEPRERPVWTATARLLVTSSEGQYIRVSVLRFVETEPSGDTARGSTSRSGGGGSLRVRDVPNVQPLLTAANLYPILIESDDIARLRMQIFGKIQGTITANAYTAVSTPSRFIPAQLPVIDIFATSETPGQAVTLADATAKTFTRWIRKEQDRTGLSPKERILIKQLRAPGATFATGGPSYGIPILVALAVIAAFGMIAILLDHFVPRRAQAPQVVKWGES